MKKTKLFLFALFITAFAGASTLKVQLSSSTKVPDANYGLGIVKYSMERAYWNQVDTMLVSENGKFKIDLQDGIYMLMFQNPYCDTYYYYIEAKGKKDIDIKAELNSLSIHQKIDHVAISGKFNDYSSKTLLVYDEEKKIYKLPSDLMDMKIEKFSFTINDKQSLHSNKLPRTEYDVWHSLGNINTNGNESIIFNPGEYDFIDTTKSEAIADPSNSDNWIYQPKVQTSTEVANIHQAIWDIQEIINTLNFYFTAGLNKQEPKDLYPKIFKEKVQAYNTIKSTIGTDHKIFLLSDLKITSNYDTAYYNYVYYSINKLKTEATKIRNSEAYQQYQLNEAIALKNLILNEKEIPKWIIGKLSPYYDTEIYYNGILDKLEIPFGFFSNFLIEYEKTHDDPEFCGEILFNKARNTEYRNLEKAKQIMNELKAKYPTYSGFENGSVETFMKKFAVVEGTAAPDFELTSLDNKKIKLSDYKGKYVFIDFWGTWCGPCCAEIPNVKKLSESFSENELVVIGISTRDTEEVLRKFIEEKEIRYQNALTNNTVNLDYGVNSYPSTFLIDKEGNIIAKNLRGSNITEMVKNIINN